MLIVRLQAYCAKCPMCKSKKTNLCGAVRKWTGNGIMKADDGVRFHHKESGKKIYHFVSSLCTPPCLSAPYLWNHPAHNTGVQLAVPGICDAAFMSSMQIWRPVSCL